MSSRRRGCGGGGGGSGSLSGKVTKGDDGRRAVGLRPLLRRGSKRGAIAVVAHVKGMPGQKRVRGEVDANGGAKKLTGVVNDKAATTEKVEDVVSVTVAKETGCGSESPAGRSCGVKKNLAPLRGGEGVKKKVESSTAEARSQPRRGSRKVGIDKVNSRLRTGETPASENLASHGVLILGIGDQAEPGMEAAPGGADRATLKVGSTKDDRKTFFL